MRSLAAAAVAIIMAGPAAIAEADATTYPAGVGSLTLAFQRIDNTGHRLSDGFLLAEGQSVSSGLMGEVAYGVTDRLTMSLSVPFVAARYTGAGPTPFQFLPVDADRRWHGSFQDVGVSARYGLLGEGRLSVTPGLMLVVPSHAYRYQGEAVVGRRLRELEVSVSAARVLQEISPRLTVEGGYGYTVVESTPVAVANDRSSAHLGVAILVTARLHVTSAARWQRTHGGLRAGSFTGRLALPGDIDSPERIAEHDRLLRDNYVHLEGGVAYSLGPIDLFSSYVHYLSGTDTHAGRAVTAGVTWFFGKAD